MLQFILNLLISNIKHINYCTNLLPIPAMALQEEKLPGAMKRLDSNPGPLFWQWGEQSVPDDITHGAVQSLQARISLGKKTKPTTLLFHCYIPIPNEHPQCVFYQVSRVRPEHRHLHSLKKCQISHATHVFNATRATLQSHTVHTCYTLHLRYTPKVCITCNTR